MIRSVGLDGLAFVVGEGREQRFVPPKYFAERLFERGDVEPPL